MNAVFVLDKPQGPTCQRILAKIRRMFPKFKAGYTGTLDPFATGVLPIFLGATTKLIPFLNEEKKRYQATLKLGVKTNTGDLEGESIEEKPIPPFQVNDLQKVFQSLLGRQRQIPPLYSAIKVQGRPLYTYARRGETIEVKPRRVEIFSLLLLKQERDQITFETEVSAGTYIRSLGEEIALGLETVGHLQALRRFQSGVFQLSDSVTLEDLEQRPNLLTTQGLTASQLFPDLDVVEVSLQQAKKLLQGQQVFCEALGPLKSQRVLVYCEQKWVALCEASPVPTGLVTLQSLRGLDFSMENFCLKK